MIIEVEAVSKLAAIGRGPSAAIPEQIITWFDPHIADLYQHICRHWQLASDEIYGCMGRYAKSGT